MTLLVVVAVSACAGCSSGDGRWNSDRDFPSTSDLHVSGARRAVLDIAHTEFDHPGEGTKYSNGVEEDRCADFVSWVYSRSGHRMKNPNSGGWRIPGVATLTVYLVHEKAWQPRSSGYQPKPGDLVIYDEKSFVGQHVNIVVRNDGGELTTVGGNEGDKIRVEKIAASDDAILGFGATLGA